MKRPVTNESLRVRELGLKDLARSGIDEADAAQLGITFLTATQTAKLLPGHEQACLYLPYHDAQGRVRKDLFRVRFLEPLPAGAFGARAEVIKPKYGQPPKSPVGVYLPPLLAERTWESVMVDSSVPVWVTEGEKKAAAATKLGFPCIGLGGVWSFGDVRTGRDLLPELERFVWSKRTVVVCFDADIMVKPEVAKAVSRLLESLTRRGALAQSLVLPELGPGVKTGLDDYLVAHGPLGLKALLTEGQALPYGQYAIELWRLNERYAVIHHPPAVYDELAVDGHGRSTPLPLNFSNFCQLEAPRQALKEENGHTLYVKVANEWLGWPGRQEYESLTYLPGSPRVIEETRQLNSWRGLAVEAKKGDVRPWTELLNHLFTGAEPEARRWFEQWCGYPIKHLGTKLLTAVAMWSPKTGQGKTLVAETLGQIYGVNFISIPQYELETDHNSWALGKQFVLVDDISSHDTRTRADLLKKLITQKELNVNVKHVPQFTLPDYLNYYFTSNHGDAFYLDEHDRRIFIHEVIVSKLDEAFFDRYYEWLRGPGPAALRWHLEHELDYTGFCPSAPPPLTAAKQEMIEGTRSELDSWIQGLGNLDLGDRDLWTAAELADRFNGAAVGRKVTANVLGRRLRLCYPCVGLVEDVPGRRNRYFALKNGAAWSKRSKKEAAKHVQATKRF